MFIERSETFYSSSNDSISDVGDEVKAHHLWTNITLTDFHSNSWKTPFSYGFLWFLSFVGVAVYGADTYTAVILLAYNRWPGQIAPAIPFDVSRWLFAACILFSWVLCAYQWWRAIMVIRRGSVAKDYLDPLAATLQSMRSWQRFLVFKELTKSKKGVDYVALFCYFQFKSAIRVVLAEGPRQAINAITLYSVMKGNLLTNEEHNTVSLSQFAANVRVLATTQSEHAAILFTMLFTLIIWVISALCLIFSVLCYVGFLLHYIERGNLTRYCKRKIEKRLRRIVELTFQKEIERQEARRRQAEERAARGDKGFLRRLRSKPSSIDTVSRSPTLPSLEKDADGFSLPPSMTTYNSEVSTRSSPTQADELPSNPLFLPHPPPAATRRPASQSRRLAKRPTLPTILGSPRESLAPFRNPSTSSKDSSSDELPLLHDSLQPAPLQVRRKPVPSLRGAVPVNPYPPPDKPMPERPATAMGRRPSGAKDVPVPAAVPHTRAAGGIGGPTTFEAMGF